MSLPSPNPVDDQAVITALSREHQGSHNLAIWNNTKLSDLTVTWLKYAVNIIKKETLCSITYYRIVDC